MKNFIVIIYFVIILIFAIGNCKNANIYPNIENFYFKPKIKIYNYTSINENNLIYGKIISVEKIEKTDFGWIFYEKHEDLIKENDLKIIRSKYNSYDTIKKISYRKVRINIKDELIDIINTSQNWLEDQGEYRLLEGPIKVGKAWSVPSSIIEINNSTVTKEENYVDYKIKRIKKINYKKKNKNLIEIEMYTSFKKNKIIQTISFLEDFGIYSFDEFRLCESKR